MYLVGGPHPNKERAEQLVRRLVESDRHLATDAEVLQEILHRYHAIGRPDAIGPALAVIRDLADTIFDISVEDVMHAREILEAHRGISARDAIHASIMDRFEIEEIMTFDSSFDQLPGLRRLR